MIVGDTTKFAIESSITEAYSDRGHLALGYFLLHIGGLQYGLHRPDATLLACSFGEVGDRLNRRGSHTASFGSHLNGGDIADWYRNAFYSETGEERTYFNGSTLAQYTQGFDQNIVWAPDGDQAFDDWSYVLQFDIQDRVRLIGFRSLAEAYDHDPSTLSDVWLPADAFYSTLEEWQTRFLEQWAATPKRGEFRAGVTNICVN